MGAALVVLALHLAVNVSAEDACAAGEACSSSLSFDTPCRDVLEVLPPGTPKLWSRTRPAVISGAVADAAWDLRAFSFEAMKVDFGETLLKVFSPAQAALLDGQTSRVLPLRRIISKLDDEQKIYVFDKEFFQNVSAKELAPIPGWLKMSDAVAFLTLGGPLSGTQFHAHGTAFLLLVAGKKRWYLHEPGQFPNASARALHLPVSAFEKDVLPSLESAPLGCVQHAGDAILVPDGWAHATINVEETLGVAWQRTTSLIKTCEHGHDYWCLGQSFVSAEKLSLKKQPQRYKELFAEANELTGDFPIGFIRHLGPYWQVSTEAKDIFKAVRSKVLQLLKASKRHSDEALLAAALVKRLADVLMGTRKDAKRASDLLAVAQKKAPEAGQGLALARLLGQQFRWKEAAEALAVHASYFPEDRGAALMLEQATNFARKAQMEQSAAPPR
ncbi:unnamed protein product [Effrenium voratum]|uniref:JmjC domain-containing protein n=1 Tax=Effrenium voratum TaxID=2562239 RepID=A0AA36MQC7_9DINO|nr:unnamed protein product [Effrenium voratum]